MRRAADDGSGFFVAAFANARRGRHRSRQFAHRRIVVVQLGHIFFRCRILDRNNVGSVRDSPSAEPTPRALTPELRRGHHRLWSDSGRARLLCSAAANTALAKELQAESEPCDRRVTLTT
jgi:hypothetical protein